MGIPSGFELVIIVAVILLLFGGKKIPELARKLGKTINDYLINDLFGFRHVAGLPFLCALTDFRS